MSSAADSAEIEKFDALADDWWDEDGPMAPLHRFNPLRIAFIRDAVLTGREPTGGRPLKGLRALDVGCGGGVLAEPLARLGADVTGIDLAGESLDAARRHAADQGLQITYLHKSVAALAAAGERFDLVVASEVIEHVEGQAAFVRDLGRVVAPEGTLCLTTVNRTFSSFAQAIVAAEYVLGWLPRGTHDWRRFVRPAELAGWLRRAGFVVTGLQGVAWDGRADAFHLTDRVSVNYMISARRS